MERHLQSVKKSILLLFITLIPIFTLTSQTVNQVEKIRFNMWADIDAYPGLEGANDYEGYDYPIKQIKEIAPYLVNGMVCGWEFSYTPYDKARGVEEYLEVREVVSEDYVNQNIEYSSPWVEENLFNCWVNYKRSEYDIGNYKLASSIQNPIITGTGYGKTDIGFIGIKDAAEDALKQAIRNHYRPIVKNKPKEIHGKVLIKNPPVIGIDAGSYVIILDFFLEWGKIIEYTVF